MFFDVRKVADPSANSIPGSTSTIAIAIYQEVTHMNDGPASALATILTVTTIVSLPIVFRLTMGKVKIV